jgi:hypothetical protein
MIFISIIYRILFGLLKHNFMVYICIYHHIYQDFMLTDVMSQGILYFVSLFLYNNLYY